MDEITIAIDQQPQDDMANYQICRMVHIVRGKRPQEIIDKIVNNKRNIVGTIIVDGIGIATYADTHPDLNNCVGIVTDINFLLGFFAQDINSCNFDGFNKH